MKRIRLLFLLLILVISTDGQTYVTTEELNIRGGKGTNYEIIGVIPNGTVVTISEISGIWGKVNYQGSIGYISTKFLQQASSNESQNNILPKESSRGISTATKWLIFFGLLLVLFLLRKTLVVKYFFLIIWKILSTIFSSNSSTSNTTTYRKKEFKYRCRSCGKLLTVVGSSGGYPSDGTYCKTGMTHDWRRVD